MVREISSGVYDITTRRDENGRRYRVFLFDEPEPTLVDTGHAGTTDTLLAELDKLEVEPEHVLITHGDGDHAGGIEAVTARYDADLFVPEQSGIGSGISGVEEYGDGDRIGPLTAVHVPGYTPHHHAFVDEERGIAVLGDAAVGADLRGLPSGHFVLPPGVYSDDLNEADASLVNLLQYDFDIGLVYHGSSVMEDARGTLSRFVNFPGRP